MSDTTTPKPGTPEAALVRADKAQLSVEGHAVVPKTLDQQLQLAKWMVESKLMPFGIDTPAKAWLVLQRGGELGFPALTATEVLYVVKGRVRLTPAGAKAKAMSSGLIEDFREEIIGEGDERRAVVTIKRRGIPTPIRREFSVKDAKVAQLWGKVGRESGQPSAWVTFPERMLLARAKGFAFSDAFQDIIGGLQVREMFDLDPGEKLGTLGTEVEPPAPKVAPPPDDLMADAPQSDYTANVVDAEPVAPPPPDPLVQETDAGARPEATAPDPVVEGAAATTAPAPEGCKHLKALMKLLALKPGRSVTCVEDDCALQLKMIDGKAHIELPEKGWTLL